MLTFLVRVFTYAKHWDFLLMTAAALAAMGSGVVSAASYVVVAMRGLMRYG